ncbi:hypothetical protein [Pseudoalteromonas obscura]|uniref:Uncharacterized protein n=1 Tax=Pseudoalteromonas obscura TaxID=3048491 RepID=A0ABT7ELX9_9GAMM|nr:hypothetical protein [Pseudoalteromonas sp. P94(2023)]MDK2596055.1 hypothetical protein [Pseudoalteromonas sp. P94(2023)]
MKLSHALAASVLLTGNVYALEPIYDADSNSGRTTQYNHGPVKSVMVQTSSAHYFAAYLTLNDQASCADAGLYNEAGNKLIAQLNVADNKSVSGPVAEGHETLAKVLKVTCYDAEGSSYSVHHKVPAAPAITYDRAMQFDNWNVGGGRVPGYFESVHLTTQLSVNTFAPDGQCSILRFPNGDVPALFNGKFSVENVHSNFYSHGGKVAYDAYSSSLTYAIKCVNAGGMTMLFDEWTINEFAQSAELSTNYY